MKNYRKTSIIFFILFTIILFSINSQASYTVPSEVKINISETLEDSTQVIVSNNHHKDLNVSWYLEKTPESYLKTNRSNLPDLSWISVSPKYQKIEANKQSNFEINIKIPICENNINKSWQFWLTFKTEETSLEQVTNVLIDTPKYFKDPTAETEIIEIIMENNFFHGNTSKKISITNCFDKEITIQSRIKHPSVFSKKNYSNIPSLSWIFTIPEKTVLKPGETKNFYIYIDPKPDKENTKQFWETWIVFDAYFTDNIDYIFTLDYKAKVFTITPENYTDFIDSDKNMKAASTDNLILSIDTIIALFLAAILLFAFILIIKNKKNKK